ncbi:MAG TPA: NAD(P)H-dependent oxidoreductase [Ornithinimicrobium sp.]|uniref:NADPH-dependent FMN reductase n=1 Tax=Ornithinimicrobium sp. TaxID=1977084 RepID=UPI002B46EC85|nr:NAD(P)H-dependent oxidoreductase [Ornithinimicrobium sp.]HKJ11332.1 NAD(P)H-dependent oxidoreductase [Ornithinimicrobium sp.]
MTAELKMALIIASSRPQRVGPTVADWVSQFTAEREHASYEVVDLAEQNLPNYDEPQPAAAGQYSQEHTRAWSKLIDGFDGFVFVTPEYNRGIPGQLKNALDFLYSEWNDKAAGIVAYGSSGGLRAVEQLKSVLGELQIATVRAQVSLSIFDDMQDFSQMDPRDFQARNVKTLLDQTERWARALRPLRSQQHESR